jgi:hypothetical protein
MVLINSSFSLLLISPILTNTTKIIGFQQASETTLLFLKIEVSLALILYILRKKQKKTLNKQLNTHLKTPQCKDVTFFNNLKTEKITSKTLNMPESNNGGSPIAQAGNVNINVSIISKITLKLKNFYSRTIVGI